MSNPTFVADELVTASKMNELPKGLIGYAQVTSSQSGITTEVDLTGLSVAVTVAASRRLRITVQALVVSTVANDTIVGNIKEGATVFTQWEHRVNNSNNSNKMGNGSVIVTPSAGAHTYKATLSRAAGTGTVGTTANATLPAFISVEDIGAV